MNTSMRFGGLASGLDTANMIKSLMQIEQLKVDRVVQQRIRMEWGQELRKDVNDQITSFRNAVMSVLSNQNLNTISAFKGNKVSGLSPMAGVDISAGSDAFAGSYSIQVNQLAAGAVFTGDDLHNLDLNGSIEQMGIVFEEGLVEFSINGVAFNFSNSTSVRQMIDTINRSEADVNARYSELTGQFTITSKTTGMNAQLVIENTIGKFAEGWNLTDGTDAIAVINGITVQRSENTFTIDQIHYRLLRETETALHFDIEQNIDGTVDRVKQFVEQYNKLLSSLQDILNQPVHRNYPPLTDAQKEEMSDREIEMWQDLAKSGLMRNDRNLSNLVSQMRNSLFETVIGTDLNLTSIGIMTGSYQENGRIHLDESVLRKALAQDPDNVMKLFTQTSEAEDGSSRFQESGLMQRLREAFAGFSEMNYRPARYAEEMVRINNHITRLNQLLTTKEEAYWKKFAAMEQALNSMYSQSEWMTASLGK